MWLSSNLFYAETNKNHVEKLFREAIEKQIEFFKNMLSNINQNI